MRKGEPRFLSADRPRYPHSITEEPTQTLNFDRDLDRDGIRRWQVKLAGEPDAIVRAARNMDKLLPQEYISGHEAFRALTNALSDHAAAHGVRLVNYLQLPF